MLTADQQQLNNLIEWLSKMQGALPEASALQMQRTEKGSSVDLSHINTAATSEQFKVKSRSILQLNYKCFAIHI
jgi:primosomal protein N'